MTSAGARPPHGPGGALVNVPDIARWQGGRLRLILARIPLPVLVVIVGLAVIVARRSTPMLVWEDGPIFWEGAAKGIPSILEPYGGYFHPLARSIALLARTLGIWQLMWIGALLVALYVASYVASKHLAPVLPEPWQRFAAGIAVLVLPGTVQTMGLIGQVQWYPAIYLLAWLVAGSANRLALAIFALTGPYAILFAPLVLLRRPAGWPIVLAGGGMQALGFLVSPRGAGLEFDGLLEVLAFRGVLGPFFGEITIVGRPIVQTVATIVIVATLAAVAVWSDRKLWPIFAGGAVVAVLGVMFAGETNEVLLLGPGARYFVALSFGFTLFVLRSPRSPLAWTIAGLLLVGVIGNFRIPLRDGYGWEP